MAGIENMIEIRPIPAELARTREFVRARAGECGLDEAARFRAALVATEAVTNAMRHGWAVDGSEAPIEVHCGCNEDGFVIEVGDRGTFKEKIQNSSPAEDATGGRGLGLIERLTRGFDLETSGNGTRLRMLVAADQAY